VARLVWPCKEHLSTLTGANKYASAWIHYEWFIQGHRISTKVGERYGISYRYLVVGATSCKGSGFRNRTLLAITVGSRQMVACTYIRTWGIRKGPTSITTAAYPKTNHGIQRNQKISCSPDTTSGPPTTTIERLCVTSRSNTIALRRNTEWRTREYN
jgi:hypothetical protein